MTPGQQLVGPPTNAQVDAARRLLRQILTRRDFVTAAGFGVLGLAGCSSGTPTSPVTPPPPSPGTIPDGFQAVTGTVSLPAGSALKLTDLSVDILTQAVPVSSAAGFTVGISPSGPSLALLLDATGNGVLMSMFDPGSATFSISSRTTAVALLYIGLDGYMLPPGASSQVLTLLQADPAVPALDGILAQAIAADPYALANNAPTVGPALSQAIKAIAGASLQAAPVKAAAKLTSGVPALLTLTPAAPQNGVTMTQDPITTSLIISNTKRRPCRIYVYETGVVPGTPSTDVSPAALVAGPLDLQSIQNLTLINVLVDLFKQNRPWSPVSLPPVQLGLLPSNADQNTYQVVVLASSLSSTDPYEPYPAVFNDAHFAPFVTTWQSDLRWLFAVTIFGDVLLPIFSLLLGAGAVVANQSLVAQTVTTASVTYKTVFDRILNQLPYGSVGALRKGLADVVLNAIQSGDAYTLMLPQVQAVVGLVEAKTLAVLTQTQVATILSKGAKILSKVLWPLLAADAALALADLGGVIIDVANSDMAASWTAVLDRQKLILQPNPPAPINAGDRVTFTVANPVNTPNGVFEYDWTQTSLFDTLSANGEVNVGNAITTSMLSVDLVTTGADMHPVNVLVVGYDTSGGSRAEIGRAGTTVNFLLPAEITPTGRIASIGDQVVFVVAVGGTVPNGVTYKWTLTGTGGTIGNSPTSVPYVTWTAANPGQTDSLHVDVLSGTTVVAKADVSVSVAGPPMIQFSITGPWDPTVQPPDGQYQFTGTYVGLRDVSPGGGGNDGIYMGYDLVGNSPDQSPGAFIAILVPSGAALQPGQVLSKYSNPPHANQFQFDLSSNLVNPADPNATLGAPIGTGTLTVNAIGQQTNGEWLMQYAFQVSNSNGGLISGSGIGKWGALGVPVNS